MSESLVETPARGKTWYGSRTPDTTNYGQNVRLEGLIKHFPNTDPSTLNNIVRLRRDAGLVTARLVRNVSGISLLPGYAVVYQAAYYHRRVDGYAKVTGVKVAGIVDDHYGSAGVQNGDLFWIIVKGQCLLKMPASQVADIVADDLIYGLTASASTFSTTAGRGQPTTITASGPAGYLALNAYAQAISAMSSSSTNSTGLANIVNLY